MAKGEGEGGEDFRAKPRVLGHTKMDAVMRLLRGESLDQLSQELRVDVHRLPAWRDDFIAAGREGSRAAHGAALAAAASLSHHERHEPSGSAWTRRRRPPVLRP